MLPPCIGSDVDTGLGSGSWDLCVGSSADADFADRFLIDGDTPSYYAVKGKEVEIMSKRRLSIRNIALTFCIAMLLVMLAVAFAACGGEKTSPSEYYLSLESKGWQTYTSENDIPDELHFKAKGNDENIFTLEIHLNEGEQFKINKFDSDESIGFSKLFSGSQNLIAGTNGSIKVAHQGTYSFELDLNSYLTYGFVADKMSVTITQSVSSMFVGDFYPFEATVAYSDGSTDNNVTWTSSDQTILTVDENGAVRALAVGSATIKADSGEFSDSVEVAVSQSSSTVTPVTGVHLDRSEASLEMGESIVLSATIEPENASNKSVFWSTDDENIVTVTQEGLVTAVGYGTTKVTVTTANGGLTAECEITVVKHAVAIKLGYEHISVVVDGEEKEISVSFSPEDTTDTEFTFEVANGSDCIQVTQEISSLKVKALKEGSATITVSCKNNPEITAQCTVTVLAKGSAVANMPENKTVVIGSTSSLKVDLENATVQNVTWSVRDESVASVVSSDENDTATITAHEFGSTVITAVVSASNGQEYTLTTNLLVADEFFFIYGYGLGAYDWDSADYLTDRNAAEKADILFNESERGVYTLTRHFTPDNGFQIIFPNVGSFTEHDGFSGEDKWNKNIPSDMVPNTTYYDAANSDRSFVRTSESSQFGVTVAGVYTVTLDLKGTSAKVSIKMVSVDVTGVSIERKSSSTMLRSGETAVFGFSCTPASATYDKGDWEIDIQSDFVGFEQYIEWSVSKEDQEITVTAKGEFPSPFVLNIRIVLKGQEIVEPVSVYPSDYKETPVTEIKFEQSHYSFNVNNGGLAWEISVKASVNEEATVQAVKYSVLEAGGWSIDSSSGLFKSSRLGTFTVLATAVGDEDFQTTCTVTFYSDTFYLTGEFNGQSDGFKVCDPTAGELDSTHSSTKFDQISETYYRLQYHFDGVLNSEEHSGWIYGFQVVFLGMDAQWSSRFKAKNGDCFDSQSFDFGNTPNVRVKVEGDYIIEVDLSSSSPKWCINKLDTPLSRLDLKASAAELHAVGDVAQILLSTAPKFADAPAGGFVWSIEGSEDYVTGVFDEESMTYSVTVNKIPHASDATITAICQAGDVSASVSFTIISEHHLVQKYDTVEHWWECTDEGCTFTEGREQHESEDGLTNTDPAGHYMKCKDCDYNSGLTPHTVPVNSSGRFDFTQETCETCGFKFFDIENGVLTRFDAKAEKITIPAEVTAIGDGAFEGHSEIVSITVKGDLISIGKNAFKGCSGLKVFQIQDSVTSIGHSAFNGVSANITWGKSPALTVLDGFDGYLGSQFTIPSSIREVSNSAFAGSNLQSITIPDNVTDIKTTTFSNCKSLTKAIVGTGVTRLKGNVFMNCTALEYVYLLNTGFYQIAGDFGDCTSLKAVYFARNHSQIAEITAFILGVKANDAIKGKCYAFATSNPGTSVDFGSYSDYFVGTWHYNGDSTPENATVWGASTQAAATTITLFFEDRTKFRG